MIRAARLEDVPAIETIVHAAFSPYVARIGKPPGPMLDDYRAFVHDGIVTVIEHAGAVAGLLVLVEHRDHLLVDVVAVDPAVRGVGLGRALLEWAERQAVARGYGEMRLYTHVLMRENIALYGRNGWRETGRAEQDGYARVFMSKTVRPGGG